jgi:fucose 4-O-acetylase-like acetyltransferase
LNAVARHAWVDYAKGIGILLVVYGHISRGLVSAGIELNERLFKLIDSIIYSFHMPLFFFLSGLFFCSSLQKRGRTELVLSKMDTILYPYVVWSILQGAVEALFSRYTNGEVTLAQVFDLTEPRAQFWFLYALFILAVIGAFVYARLQPRFYGAIVLVSALIFIFQSELPDLLNADYVYYSFVFFAMGIWFNAHKRSILQNSGSWLLPLSLLFVAGQWLFHVFFGMTYEDISLPLLALAAISILFVVALASQLSKLPMGWISSLGYSSMVIYLMHVLVGSGVRVVLQKFMAVESPVVHLLVGVALAVLLPMLALHLIKRWNLMFLIEAPRHMSGQYWYQKKLSTSQ